MTKKDHDAENVAVVKSANMTREDHDAEIATVVKYANMANKDHNVKNVKEVKYAYMTKLDHDALIATGRIYANQDTTHIIQAAELQEIENTADSAHIVLQIYFQMISKH